MVAPPSDEGGEKRIVSEPLPASIELIVGAPATTASMVAESVGWVTV